jgi:hypothetical protein
MTEPQAAVVSVLLAARAEKGDWAEIVREVDGAVLVEFGGVHHGVRERSIGHYVVRPDLTVSKYVGL